MAASKLTTQHRQLERLLLRGYGYKLGQQPPLTPSHDCGVRGDFSAGNRAVGELRTGELSSRSC